MKRILLSIILVNYNGESFIEECLDSLFANKTSFNYQTILVDNASTDSSVAKISTYTDRLQLIKNSKNVGFSNGNNQCLPLCKGKYILLLNTDTVLEPDNLETMIQFMEENPEVGALSPKLLNSDGSLQVQGSALGAWRYHSKKPRPIPFICGACLLTKKSIMDEIGGLNPDLFFYNDDIFFCKQLKDLNYPIYYLPTTSLIHHGGLSSKKEPAKLKGSALKGSLMYCKAFYPSIIYKIFKNSLTVILAIKIEYHKTMKLSKSKEYINAYIDVLQSMRKSV